MDTDIDGFFSTARVSARDAAVELPAEDYRAYLQDPDDPDLLRCRGMTYEQFAADRHTAPFLADLLEYWDSLYREPFVGITSDGVPRADVHALPPAPPPDPAQSDAAARLIGLLTPEQRDRVSHPVDAPQWRAWSNPEFVVHRVGLRLEDLAAEVVEAVLDLMRASLSPEGFERVHGAMVLNGHLGDLVGLPNVMNPGSYWFSLFGTPSVDGAWGWQLFGHHVAVNVVSVAGRPVIAPVFLGAEPALSDGHPPLFAERERAMLELASSLTPEQRAEAVVYGSVLDPAMPPGRLHPADERHVAGAFRDNRVVPYEGVCAAGFSARQRELLLWILGDHLLLREPHRAAALTRIEGYLDETRFAWYGATDGSQPFYVRIQSPAVLAELDHHAGVWLTNRLPARFHVHTILRLPNGNDYGRAFLDRWRGE